MNVYVVIEVWYSNTNIVAAFSTKEKAQKFIDKQKKPINFSCIELEVK